MTTVFAIGLAAFAEAMAAKAASATDAPLLKIKLDANQPLGKLATIRAGTSLSIVSSFVVALLCDFVDIDGTLLLKQDHPLGLEYSNGVVNVFDRRFWG